VGVSDSKKTLTQELQTQELQKDSVNINSIKEDDASLKDIAKSALKTAYKSLNTVGGGLLGAAIGAAGFSMVGFAWLPIMYLKKIYSIIAGNGKLSDIPKNLLLYLPMDVILHPIMGAIGGLAIGALKSYKENPRKAVSDVVEEVPRYNEMLKNVAKNIKEAEGPMVKNFLTLIALYYCDYIGVM
jgi:hypothetical protein